MQLILDGFTRRALFSPSVNTVSSVINDGLTVRQARALADVLTVLTGKNISYIVTIKRGSVRRSNYLDVILFNSNSRTDTAL